MALDRLRALRMMTSAPIFECRAALVATHDDVEAAAVRLRAEAVARIAAASGSPDHARIAFAKWGWDLDRAVAEARRLALVADPVRAALVRRQWQDEILAAAACSRQLITLVYEANVAETALGRHIQTLANLELVLEDETGTDLGHAISDYPRFLPEMLASLQAIGSAEALELARVIQAGQGDEIGRVRIDVTVARSCLAALAADHRAALVKLLDLV